VKIDFKLQHYASLALPIAGIVISEVLAANTSGGLALSAHLVQILIVAGKIDGLLTVSINRDANAKAALAAGDVVPLNVVQQAARNEVTKP
jgi:hypothetical protein